MCVYIEKASVVTYYITTLNNYFIPILLLQKYFVVLAYVVVSVSSQRPSYAGLSSRGVPELASRFRTDSTDSTSTTTTTGTTGGIANRVGDTDSTTSSSTPRLPIDARGDAELVNRINQWPRENQPFWFINSGHIEKHRNTPEANSGSSMVSCVICFHRLNYYNFSVSLFIIL